MYFQQSGIRFQDRSQRRNRSRHNRNGYRRYFRDVSRILRKEDRQGHYFRHRFGMGHTADHTGHGHSADAGFQRHERGHSGGRSKLGAVYQDSKGQGSVPQGLVLHRGGQNIRRKRFQHFDEVYFAEPHIYHNNIGYAGPACGYLIHHFDGLLGTGRAAASA